MADPTSLNSQITDSVTQINTSVLGDSPAVAMGNMYQATAQALGNAAHNATTAQQQATLTSQVVNIQGVAILYCIDTMAISAATKKVLS